MHNPDRVAASSTVVDTVVVGAGIGGLQVAASLHARGLSVVVLEARERVGGRLLSVPLGAERFDLGATWFWDGEQHVAALLARLGVQRFAQHLAGCAVYDGPDGPQRMADNPVDLPSWRITGGAQRIAELLAATLPTGTVRLGEAVHRVDREPAGVRVTTTGLAVLARHAVLALPPALAMQRLAFQPPLPDAFTAIAAHTPVWMGAMTKAVAVYPDAFWRAEGLAGSAFSPVGPMREVHDMSPAGGRPGALFGFIPFGGLDGGAATVCRQLERLFGARARAPLHLEMQAWHAEPFSAPRGVERLADYGLFGHPVFTSPLWDGTLHLAGTETSPVAPGHIEGALAAAQRCAGAIVAARAAGDR